MDLLNWLIGKRCIALSSFGSLSHFKPENAPPDSTGHCLDGCPHKDTCPYYVMRYLEPEKQMFMRLIGTTGDTVPDNFLQQVKDSRYGRCVYRCDNDVVDHQVVNLRYENDITVAFTMCAFTHKTSRTIKIMGTKGELQGYMEKNEIKVIDFLTDNIQRYSVSSQGSGHGGGDFGIMKDFLAVLRGQAVSSGLSTAEDSLHSHEICFAAEQSRLNSEMVKL